MSFEHQSQKSGQASAESGGKENEAARARQGEAPDHMRYVLAVSTVTAAAVLAILYFVFF